MSGRSKIIIKKAESVGPWLSFTVPGSLFLGYTCVQRHKENAKHTNAHVKALKEGKKKLTPWIVDAFLRLFLCYLRPANLQMLLVSFSSVTESLFFLKQNQK